MNTMKHSITTLSTMTLTMTIGKNNSDRKLILITFILSLVMLSIVMPKNNYVF
jgi:hypothetical protein